MKINLTNVTLVVVDDLSDLPTENNIRYIILDRVIKYAKKYIDFFDVKFFSPLHGFEKTFTNAGDYSKWIIKNLPYEIESDYYLIIQWDGFIVNPDMWRNEFFNYDYIGGGNTLQNGGFSLRKTSTMKKLSNIKYTDYFGNEDSFYSLFFEDVCKNVHKTDSRFDENFYNECLENGWIYKDQPFSVYDIHDKNSDCNRFVSFFTFNPKSFGWHWSGELDIYTSMYFYKKIKMFSLQELKMIDTYLRKRSNRGISWEEL
jgi:hypothetical protein